MHCEVVNPQWYAYHRAGFAQNFANAQRAVERGFYSTVTAASDALRALSKGITKDGLPKGTLVDTAHSDRVLVPLKEGAYAVSQVLKNGTARLKTVLIEKEKEVRQT